MRTRRIFSCGGIIEQTFKLKEPKTFDEQLQILTKKKMYLLLLNKFIIVVNHLGLSLIGFYQVITTLLNL